MGRGARLPTGADELFGDVGLALQPGKPQRPIHRYHRLAAFQPLALDGDDLTVGGGLHLE